MFLLYIYTYVYIIYHISYTNVQKFSDSSLSLSTPSSSSPPLPLKQNSSPSAWSLHLCLCVRICQQWRKVSGNRGHHHSGICVHWAKAWELDPCWPFSSGKWTQVLWTWNQSLASQCCILDKVSQGIVSHLYINIYISRCLLLGTVLLKGVCIHYDLWPQSPPACGGRRLVIVHRMFSKSSMSWRSAVIYDVIFSGESGEYFSGSLCCYWRICQEIYSNPYDLNLLYMFEQLLIFWHW